MDRGWSARAGGAASTISCQASIRCVPPASLPASTPCLVDALQDCALPRHRKRDQDRAVVVRSGRVAHPRANCDEAARRNVEIASLRGEPETSPDGLDAHGPCHVMRGERGALFQGDERDPQRPLFDQRLTSAPLPETAANSRNVSSSAPSRNVSMLPARRRVLRTAGFLSCCLLTCGIGSPPCKTARPLGSLGGGAQGLRNPQNVISMTIRRASSDRW